MDQVKENTARQFPNSLVAWEGLEIDLLSPLTTPAKPEVETQMPVS
jgi:hypothetical protein